MKKILHISYISCFIFASNISTANTDATQSGTSDQLVDLIVVEHEGISPLPKKKLQKLKATQTTNTAARVQPATPTVPAQPGTGTPTVAVQPATPATVAVQPAAPATVAVQPAAPAVVAAIPKPSGPIDCLYQLPQAPVSENELSLWAQYAALKSFEYSFDKLDDQLQKLKYCFTDQGWTGFHDALQQSGNLSVIKSQQLTVSSQISGDPVINKIKENQWSISLPLSVVYQNTQEKFTQSLSVTLVVTKKTPTELGIVQLIATVKPETVSAS